MSVRKNIFFLQRVLKIQTYLSCILQLCNTCLIKILSLQALGEDADFAKPHTMRVIEKFLVDCSEAVSKRYTRYDCLINVISGRGAKEKLAKKASKLQYSSQIVETGAICLEFSPNFLHSLLTPSFSVKCTPLLPQC